MTVEDTGEAEAEITAAEAEAGMADIRVGLEIFFWCINSLPMWYADMRLNQLDLLSFTMH